MSEPATCANCDKPVEQGTMPNGDVIWRHLPRKNIYCSKRHKATPKEA